jgi:hypothetical protein
MNIRTVVEAKRGCGYRVPGALYLRTDGMGRVCGALPIELSVCPTCHQGIKPARGWTWINIAALVEVRGCKLEGDSMENEGRGGCGDCPIADAKIQTAGLIWVGEKFYKTPGEFSREANQMGISRRITMVPRGFKIGETWVALAHRKAIHVRKIPDSALPDDKTLATLGFEKVDSEKDEWKPGIFHIFKPQGIEYVVKDDDPEDKLEKLEKRGITLVKVEREQTEMKEVIK